jgi:formyl-CoA transferase
MYGAAPEVVRRNGNHSVVSCTPKFETADGMIQVTVLHQRHWQALCENAGTAELANDPRFAGNDRRCAAQGQIEELLNPLMRKRRRHEWVELLRAAKLPCGPERDYAEVTVDAELHARGMLYQLPSADGGSLQVRMPLEFATTPRAAPEAPPSLFMKPKKH